MPRLTILICTHDRAGLLAKTLDSLNAASRPDDWAIDILVAANACSDTTHAFLDEYQGQAVERGWLPLAWFAEPVPGKSNALNSALPRVASDVVAFVDDDHRVDAGYLAAVCRAAAAHAEFDIFCGRILPDWDGSEPAWVHDKGPYRIYPLPVPRFDQGDEGFELTPDRAVPGGGNLFLRTPWASRIGGFATDMGPTGHDLGGAEDMDWVLRALRLGARLRYVPEMVQYHYVDASRLTLGYLMRKAYIRTASTVRIDPEKNGSKVPRYLYRKLAEYGAKAVTAINPSRRRFYLVRTAAALGEVAGHLHRRQPGHDAAHPTSPLD
ncbi:MAG: glycosyltransferase family 2 protein [Anderseniella sp.]|jgi:GT2 family glycosyltransferase|nr:glycosyltransferase family 2 protein [Anderseniella sp.]